MQLSSVQFISECFVIEKSFIEVKFMVKMNQMWKKPRQIAVDADNNSFKSMSIFSVKWTDVQIVWKSCFLTIQISEYVTEEVTSKQIFDSEVFSKTGIK